MAEEKKGHAKICIDIEINEALMEIIKESMKNMPQMMKMMGERRRKSEE